MTQPNDRSYIASHEWLLDMGEGRFRIGLTDFAQRALGDIVFIDLPQVGDAVTADARLGDVESVKAVSEIMSPVSARVVAVNDSLCDAPEQINGAPYDAWLIEVADVSKTAELLDAAAYQIVCEQA